MSCLARLAVLSLVLSGAFALPCSGALALSPPNNRLVTPGAEDPALPGWTNVGWSSAAYGEPGRPPADEPGRLRYGDGSRLFAASSAGGTMTQIVDVSDIAASIDYPTPTSLFRTVGFGGDFGGQGASADTASISVQALDAASQPISKIATAGNPTARDRGNQTTLLDCIGNLDLPAGTRALKATVSATGAAAMADALFVIDGPIVRPAVFTGNITADGPGCASRVKLPGFDPPVAPVPDAAGKFTAKMSLARATINRSQRVLDVLAPITARASGRARVELHAAGRRYRFTAPIDSANGRIRFRQRIPAAQAQLGTGIVTITYAGDGDTRPQTVRLRAAFRPAILRLQRPRIANGRIRASGTVNALARGVVRLQLEYDNANASTAILRFRAQINNGRWSLNEQLSETALLGIAQRHGTLHSYTLFTGYIQARMRGEMRSFQIFGDR